MATEIIGMRYLQQQCRVYCEIASSSFENLVDFKSRLVHKHLQMYFVTISTGPLQCNPAKCCLVIASESVKSFSEFLCTALRQWSISVVVKAVFRGIVIVNPRLCGRQRRQLISIISRTLNYFVDHHTVNSTVLKGILALASPDRGTFLLLGYLIDVLATLASNEQNENKDSRSSPLDLESAFLQSELNEEKQSDAQITDYFLHQFAIEHSYVATMTPSIRRAVFEALKIGDFSPQVNYPHDVSNGGGAFSSPVCCITLEALLSPDGKITRDVVALRSHGNNKDYAFLYRGLALFDWLGRKQIPTNPRTRSSVKPSDIFRIS